MGDRLTIATLCTACFLISFGHANAQPKGPLTGPTPPRPFEPPKVGPPTLGPSVPQTQPPSVGLPPSGPSLPGTGAPVGGGSAGCHPNCPIEPDPVGDAIRMAAGGGVFFLNEQERRLKDLELIQEPRRRVEATLTILAAGWLIPLPHVADAIQRDAVIKQARNELQNLLQQALIASTALMVADVRRLTPFTWNPFAGARRAEVERMEREVVDTSRRAAADISEPARFREIRSPRQGAIQYRPGPAMSQLRQIHQTRLWRNQ